MASTTVRLPGCPNRDAPIHEVVDTDATQRCRALAHRESGLPGRLRIDALTSPGEMTVCMGPANSAVPLAAHAIVRDGSTWSGSLSHLHAPGIKFT
jgi:hypothetical protein